MPSVHDFYSYPQLKGPKDVRGTEETRFECLITSIHVLRGYSLSAPENITRVCVKENFGELKTLRGLHRLYDLSASLGWAEGLSARGGQNCVQTVQSACDHVGGASPVRAQRAVPPHLSLG